MSTPTAPTAAQPAPVTPEAPVAPKKALLDYWSKSIGMSPEEMASAQEAEKKLQRSMVGAAAIPTQLQKQPEPPKDPAATAPSTPTEPSKAPEPSPEPAQAPKARKKPLAQQPMDEERLARVAGRAAAEAVQAAQPKPAPKVEAPEPEIPKELRRMYRNYEALEQMDPSRKGVTKQWLDAVMADRMEKEARTKEYIRSWKSNHPGETYDGEAQEHNEFFNAIEAEPLPDVGVPEEELEDANEFRLKREARDEALKEMREREREVDKRVRRVESQGEVTRAVSSSVANVLKELNVESVDKADEFDQPVLNEAVSWVQDFTTSAYNLINGLEKPDEANNESHQRVRQITTMLRRELAAKTNEDPEATTHEGRYYVDPGNWNKVPEAERHLYWTIGAEDVIERGQLFIVEEAQKVIQQQQKQFEARAKKMGIALPTKAPASTPAPVAAQRSVTPSPMKTLSPSISAGVITAPVQGQPSGTNGQRRYSLADGI